MEVMSSGTSSTSCQASREDFGLDWDWGDFGVIRDWDRPKAPSTPGVVQEHKTRLPLEEIEPGVWGTQCPTCDHASRAREVHLDSDLVSLLEWLWESSDFGKHPVGVTKRRNPYVPDWVVSGRHYGQLRYFGLVLGSAGTYSCLPRAGEFLLGKLTLPETLWVMDDKVVKTSTYRIGVDAARGRKRGA